MMSIARLVREGRARTRGEIAKVLSMRSTSVSDRVGELVSREIIHEVPIKPMGRGRPGSTLRFNEQRFGAIFISVQDRRLVAKAVDLSFRVLADITCEPSPDADNAEIARHLRQLVGDMLQAFPAGLANALIVLSLPGVLDVPRSLWCVSSRWPRLQSLQLSEALGDQPWPIVLIRNLDAELTGLALVDEQAGSDNILLLHWGHGIGAAFSAQGIIVNRHRGRFCEIGHWDLNNGAGRACTCGNRDCLETVAALWSIGPDLLLAHPGLALDEENLAQEMRGLDLLNIPSIRLALNQMLRQTANLCRLLFPDRIVLTGPFVQNPDVFRQFVDALAGAPLVRSLDKVRISVKVIGQRHEIVGALQDPFETVLAEHLRTG